MSYPVVIGALGGSGTRAIAAALLESGYFLGEELNRANDTLLFTRIFKNPKAFKNLNKPLTLARVKAFTRVMSGERLTLYKAALLHTAMLRNTFYPTTLKTANALALTWLRQDVARQAWGIKEPNTQLFAAQFLNCHKSIRYVYVVRHGLDMAFSANKNQLHLWGRALGLPITGGESEAQLAVLQLDYWILSMQRAHALARQFPDRVHILNTSRLFADAPTELSALFGFLNHSSGIEQVEQLAKHIKTPDSHERFRQHDLQIFRKDQLAFVEKVGFSIA